MDKPTVDKIIQDSYASLTPAMKRSARFILDHPKSIALNSMRSVAAEAGIAL